MRPAGKWLARMRQRIVQTLTVTLVSIYESFETYHVPDAKAFSEEATPIVFGAQRALADAVSQAFTEIARNESGQELSAPHVPSEHVHNLRGVPTERVYKRPFEEVWETLEKQEAEIRKLEREEWLGRAIERGKDRLKAIADEDLQSTYSNAARYVMQNFEGDAQPKWYRRVPQGSHTCALCLLISTRRFKIGNLSPVHPNCDCAIVPQYTPTPEGFVLDEDLLRQVHERVLKGLGVWSASGKPESPEGIDYRQILFEMTEDHGELGEMLVRPNRKVLTKNIPGLNS